MYNRRLLVIFFFFLPFVSSAQRKNSIREVRDSTWKEIELIESAPVDTASYFRTFDSLMHACKIRAIYLENSGTGANHYIYPGIIIINGKSKRLLIDKLLSELAHGKQFAERALFYAKKAVLSVLGAYARSVLNKKEYQLEAESLKDSTKCSATVAYTWVSYKREHKNPRSWEFEAHEVIEPQLRCLLWRHVKKEKKDYFHYEIL